jgi:hypothetical protein
MWAKRQNSRHVGHEKCEVLGTPCRYHEEVVALNLFYF